MSLYPKTLTVATGQTGLVGTIGFYAVDSSFAELLTETTVGITEIGTTGVYQVDVPNWNSDWSGTIIWVYGINTTNQPFSASIVFDPQPVSPTFDPTQAYISVEDASIYFSTRLNTDVWTYSNSEQQFKALAMATRAIDRLNFVGARVSATQPLCWPRIYGCFQMGMTPNDILMATCELGLTLLDGVDPELEDTLLNSNANAYATVRVTSDSSIGRDHIKAGIPSITAWRYLLPWMNNGRSLRLRKV